MLGLRQRTGRPARFGRWHATCLPEPELHHASAPGPDQPADQADRPFNRVLARNIDGLMASRRAEERHKSAHDRISDAITRFTGSLRFVYIHAACFGGWIVWNLGWIPGLPPFDPTFVVLAMLASVEAIFLSTFVLISQNRMQALAEKRAELDVQISLLAEHEITQLMALLDAVARRLDVEVEQRSEIENAKRDVDPGTVLDAIERRQDGESATGI